VGHNYLWQRLAFHTKNTANKTRRKQSAEDPDSAYYNTHFPKTQENFWAKLRSVEKEND
jgi:hypothetical protein